MPRLSRGAHTGEQNIRLFFAVKAILEAAAEAVGLDIPGKVDVLIFPHIRISAFIALYNIRLEELGEERKLWESVETRLEKVLKMLPAIDTEKLEPSPDSMKQIRDNILKDSHGEEWLRTKVRSIQWEMASASRKCGINEAYGAGGMVDRAFDK
jgi:hypothetical protein